MTLFDSIDYNVLGYSVHGILQARTHWSGLPFSSPGDLPDPEIKLGFPALEADAYTNVKLYRKHIYIISADLFSQFFNFKFFLIKEKKIVKPIGYCGNMHNNFG